MTENKHPKDLFELCANNLFFYKSGKEIVELMKSKLEKISPSRLRRMVSEVALDITVLLEGDITHPRYAEAFKKYSQFYDNSNPQELWKCYRFLCETFDINPKFKMNIKQQPPYKPSSGIQEAERDNTWDDEDIPF